MHLIIQKEWEYLFTYERSINKYDESKNLQYFSLFEKILHTMGMRDYSLEVLEIANIHYEKKW